MSTILSDDVLSYIGKVAEPLEEVVTRRDIRKYSIATGQRLRKFLDGDIAPPMFHLALFWDVVELDQLTDDGVSVDLLLPQFPLTRAMAGGLEIKYHKAIYPGDVLVAVRTLSNIYEKQGSSGPLIFYEVTMEIKLQTGEAVITQLTTRILR